MAVPKVVAEIGCNHKGDADNTMELISTAAIFCTADYVKLHKRNNRELSSAEQYNAPYPNPANNYGATCGEHREFLEFLVKQHRELKNYRAQMDSTKCQIELCIPFEHGDFLSAARRAVQSRGD